MVLTREEREKLVLDLYNEGKSTREIAQIAHMSFRDISFIIDKKEKEQESKEGQTRQGFLSTQSYKLFSEGKTPEEVAIALNLRQPQVTEFYTEHWKLKGLYMLNQIYEEIQGNIGYFVNLYRLVKAARMNIQHVPRLLEIANNDLPSVELRYEKRKRELDSIEAEKRNSIRIFQKINDQIISMRERLNSISLDCEKELAQRSVVSEKNETRGCCKSL
jgi:transposase